MRNKGQQQKKKTVSLYKGRAARYPLVSSHLNICVNIYSDSILIYAVILIVRYDADGWPDTGRVDNLITIYFTSIAVILALSNGITTASTS